MEHREHTNRCLRTIMPVFTTIPTHACHASGVRSPAPSHTLERHEAASSSATDCQNRHIKPHLRKAARPAATRTPRKSDAHPPHTINLARRKPGMPNKFKESTKHKATKAIPINIEKNHTNTQYPTMASLCTREAIYTKADNKPARRGCSSPAYPFVVKRVSR